MVVPFSRSHFTRLIHDARFHRKKEEAFEPLSQNAPTLLLYDMIRWRKQFSGRPRRDCFSFGIHPVNNNISVGIWKGWNAALIASKHKCPPRDDSMEEDQSNKSKRNIEPSSVKWSLTGKVGPLKSCSRKRKRIMMLNSKQQSTASTRINDSPLAYPNAFSSDGMTKEDIKLWKEGVEAFSMHALVEVRYVRLLREFVGDDSYRRIVESLFKSVVKFVLSVFDKEDFERIHHHGATPLAWKTLCSKLPDKIGIATKEEVIAKAVNTVIKESHMFPALTDSDFCQILGRYAEEVNMNEEIIDIENLKSTMRRYMGKGNHFEFMLSAAAVNGNVFNNSVKCPILMLIEKGKLQEDDISKSFRNDVIEEAMQNFVHLKEYCKTQLGLELICANGYRVFDTLVIEVLKDVKIDNLFEISHKVPEIDPSVRDLSDGRKVVNHVISGFVDGLHTLGWFKSLAVKYSQDGIACCLSNAFGPCEAEVIEVIKIADHERRLNNKRSISLENINYGLSLSGVADLVMEIPAGSLPSFSIIEFFKLLRQKASDMGHRDVGLRHMILAVKDLVEKACLVPVDGEKACVVDVGAAAAKDLKRLKKRNINNRHVRSWKEISPMCRILHSRRRVFNGLCIFGAGPAVWCARKVREARIVDVSWIRKCWI